MNAAPKRTSFASFFCRFRTAACVFLLHHGRFLCSLLLAASVLLISTESRARMGGGGGSSGGDSSGDGDILDLIFLIFYLLDLLPFPFNLLAVAFVLFLAGWGARHKQQGSVLNELPASKKQLVRDARSILAFSRQRPDFDENAFLEKVRKAFLDIQGAWSAMDIARVRRFLSDGMYQRVNTQFAMMRVLNQRNVIESLEVRAIAIDRIESDGRHDVIHAAVLATVRERFTSPTYPVLDSVINEEFVEYWSFIRKTTASGKDMYQQPNCPNCGGDLASGLGELSRCPYCGTITNAGDYDWVLAKITPADDYRLRTRRGNLAKSLADKLEALGDDDPEFSVLMLEDKASNAFLQMETARILKNPQHIRRFASDAFMERFTDRIAREPDFVYNRIFLNDVTIVGAMQKENRNTLAVSIKFSFQRVRLDGDKAYPIDPVVTSRNQILLLERDVQAAPARGSLYTHQCPACGGTLSDTTDIACPYCGGLLNAPRHEWIVADVLSPVEYETFFARNQQFFTAGITPAKLESILKVRDYAFNNVLLMLSADGSISDGELEFARRLARKWGYAPDRLEGLLQMARNNQLVLRVPRKPKDREKVYRMMCKAAAADASIAPQEQALLDFYRQQTMDAE